MNSKIIAAVAAVLLASSSIAAAGEAESPGKTSVDLRLVTNGQRDAGDTAPMSTLYVKRDGAELKEDSRRSADVVAELAEGTQLTVLEQRGAQLHVRTEKGMDGWIAKLNTTDSKPRAGLGGVRILKSDDLGPGERSNVTAIRGLQEMAENYADQMEVSEEVVQDVRTMETISQSIQTADLDRFLAEGGVQ